MGFGLIEKEDVPWFSQGSPDRRWACIPVGSIVSGLLFATNSGKRSALGQSSGAFDVCADRIWHVQNSREDDLHDGEAGTGVIECIGSHRYCSRQYGISDRMGDHSGHGATDGFHAGLSASITITLIGMFPVLELFYTAL